jgi:hypothetical protein
VHPKLIVWIQILYDFQKVLDPDPTLNTVYSFLFLCKQLKRFFLAFKNHTVPVQLLFKNCLFNIYQVPIQQLIFWMIFVNVEVQFRIPMRIQEMKFRIQIWHKVLDPQNCSLCE